MLDEMPSDDAAADALEGVEEDVLAAVDDEDDMRRLEDCGCALDGVIIVEEDDDAAFTGPPEFAHVAFTQRSPPVHSESSLQANPVDTDGDGHAQSESAATAQSANDLDLNATHPPN